MWKDHPRSLQSGLVHLASVLLLTAVAAAQTRPAKWGAASDPAVEHVPGYVLVKLADPAKAERVLGGEHRHLFGRWYRVATQPGEKAMDALERFAALGDVELVELSYLHHLAGQAVPAPAVKLVPDDPLYDLPWHLDAVGAPTAWEISTGAGVVAGLVDSGLSLAGEDLDCRPVLGEYNSLEGEEGPGSARDEHGHGTHVSGTIGQCTDNGVGTSGVAPDALLLAVEACRIDGSCPADTVAEGIVWVAEHGARVINLSIGTPCGNDLWPACSADVLNDAIDFAVARDVVLVAAAGNSGQSVVARPGNHPEVLAVSALDATLDLAGYSNVGEAMSLAAPGGSNGRDDNHDGYPDGVLQETILDGCQRNGVFYFDSGSPAACYGFYQGTSMAVPHVVGAVAVLRSRVPSATRSEVHQALFDTALDLGAPGRDSVYGYGVVQIPEALARLEEIVAAGPCQPGPQTACLLDGKFRVEGAMRTLGNAPVELPLKVMDFAAGRAESAQAVFFESFEPGNFEVGVKMVDGCDQPEGHPWRHMWVFFGGLTNAATDILVEDVATGDEVRWSNPSGQFPRTVGDTSAFACLDGGGLAGSASCVADAETACLLGGRFRVTGTMLDFASPPREFPVRVMAFEGGRAESDQAVFLEWVTPGNFEIGVKMVDACGLPDTDPLRAYWVFYGGLTSAEAAVRVTRMATGEVDLWSNPPGSLPLAEGRTSAFPCEP